MTKEQAYLEEKKWDSEFFGVSIAALDISVVGTPHLAAALSLAEAKKYRCLYCLCPEESPKNKILVDNKFVLVDSRVTYEQKLGFRKNPSEMYTRANNKDIPELSLLSQQAFRGATRFYRDSHFDTKKVDGMYVIWMENLVRKPDSWVLVARDGGKISGFVGVSENEKAGRIELIAVRPENKGQGIGARLIDAALSQLQKDGCGKVVVATQKENIAATGLYSKMGFELSQTENWYHRWN